MDELHDTHVRTIADSVRFFYENNIGFRVFHGSTNSTRTQTYSQSSTLDISKLNRVLHIDVARKSAIVEPNVPMDALVKATLAHGLLPKVVMEFPGITVGGGIQGGAGESSSFKYGCFNQICNWYQIVQGDGTIVTASSKQNPDLFYGIAGSYGTLGVITATEISLIPATKYVHVTYAPVSSFDDMVARSLRLTQKNNRIDYIDGIMFSKDSGVVISGVLSNKKVGKTVRFSRARDQWFYLHAQAIRSKNDEYTESVPITDYLFRYDRGAFWTGRFPFERAGWPFNRFTRAILNPILKTRKLYQALQMSGAAQEYIVQDMAVPQQNAVEFMRYVDEHIASYPLWVCPLRPSLLADFQPNAIASPMAINVGIWAEQKIAEPEAFARLNRALETTLHKLGGKKWFYAHSYYTETEFWKIYDKSAYTYLRKKYAATSLPNIYDKIRVRDEPPVHIKKAAFKTLFGVGTPKIKP